MFRFLLNHLQVFSVNLLQEYFCLGTIEAVKENKEYKSLKDVNYCTSRFFLIVFIVIVVSEQH